jgi:endoglucanase
MNRWTPRWPERVPLTDGPRRPARDRRGNALALVVLVVAILVVAVVVAVQPSGGPRAAAATPAARAPIGGTSTGSDEPAVSGSVNRSTPLMPPPALFVPDPNPGALAQVDFLRGQGRTADAALIQAMIDTPSAVWLGGGSPAEVVLEVDGLLARAGSSIPVLVAYNVPGRDCAQYSAGGAADAEAYRAWIDGLSKGIADRVTIVILEPDGLALQPSDCGQPDPFDRASLIHDAVDRIRTDNPNARVYLDAGHSAWHPASEMARRLISAGVRGASGFFVNASNYRTTPELVAYGTAISTCIARSNSGGDCRDAPATGLPTTDLLPFVVDTSRNGQGPWTPSSTYPDAQDWCNPPGRGLGLRPTLSTGTPLVDAYLWIKIPGESDGICTRGRAPGSADPEWGIVDPAAGRWFPQQALQLAQLANPPLGP